MTNKLCYLIDDDPDDQDIFFMALADLGLNIECTTASNGEDGLRALQTRTGPPPDYIFIDINMPRMNGMDCLTEIRKLDFLNETVVIMYSTTGDNATKEQALKRGAQDFVKKPNSITEFIEILGTIFRDTPARRL